MKNILLSLALTSQFLYANISGVGIGQTQDLAKKEALADLSRTIKSEVRSNFESTTRVKNDNDDGTTASSSNIKVSSNLPILGVDFSDIFIDEGAKIEASLSPTKVSRLYTKKLQNLNDEIESNTKEIKKAKSNSLKLKLYEELYSLLKDYDRYESVAIILDAKLENRPRITKSEVRTEMLKLSSNIDSLNMATEVLSSSFTQKNIFIYPPLMQNNTTVAQFGSVFMQELKGKLSSASSLKSASYILVGEYTLTKKSMILNYALMDVKSKKIVESKTLNLPSKTYKGLEVKPKGIDFDSLLNAGVISSSNLKVNLNSNRGSENLLFSDGEEIELFVKLNKMGYIYIVGYTQTSDGKMSYLLELSEGGGDSKFIKFINADDASRWISLGAFTIEPPFGVESLQVIASNKKITTLPNAKYDEESGYYIISKDIKKALTKTRGLKKKKSKKAEISEAVMSFTTVKK